MCIIESGPDKIISDHIAEISALRNGIFQLVYTIQKTGDCFPADLDTVCELMQMISESEKSGCSLPKGVEYPLALLHNLIATKIFFSWSDGFYWRCTIIACYCRERRR